MANVIFDLDQTLIDSKIALSYRSARNWNSVYKLIPKFKLYEGICEVIEYLQSVGANICIVTSSPISYCSKVIEHFNLPITNMICYHDTANHKPSADPILKAISKFDNSVTISIGDHENDIIASKKANIVTVGCTWDADDIVSLKKSYPDYLCDTPYELLTVLKTLIS